MKFSQLLQLLEPQIGSPLALRNLGDDPELVGIAPIATAGPGQLSFIESAKLAAKLMPEAVAGGVGALILPEGTGVESADRPFAWVAVRDPKALFALAVRQFYQPFVPAPGIHPTAVIDPSVRLGQDVAIGAHVVVQAGAVIGDRACLHPNVVVYPEVQIGQDTLLHANCTLHERTVVGDRCTIHSGAVIGAEGFGFVPTAAGWLKLEQTGQVIVENDVVVGCNSTIDRPAMGETRLGAGTIIDNLVHIGHGGTIGPGCALAAQVGLAGGVTLGRGVILAGQVGLANGVKMGDRAIATSKSGLHEDVPAGEIVSGYPAIANRLWLKTAAIERRLPEMYKLLEKVRKSLGLGT